jgi:hypothetical protein
MKTFLYYALVVLLPAVTFAQKPDSRVRRTPVPPGAARGSGGIAPSPVQNNRPGRANPATVRATTIPAAEALTKNVTLTWKGTFQGMTEVDFEMTGVGPKFVSDFAAKKADPDDSLPPAIFTINATLTKAADGYRVTYSVGARIAIPTSTFSRPGGGTSTNIEFRDLVISGTAIVKPGKSLVLSKLNDKELTLEITETE